MKYRDVSWNLMINDEQADCDDNALDFIGEQIQEGYTSGMFTTEDDFDYDGFDKAQQDLEIAIGRDVDCDYYDKGELEDLLDIAKKKKDSEVVYLIENLLKIGWGDE